MSKDQQAQPSAQASRADHLSNVVMPLQHFGTKCDLDCGPGSSEVNAATSSQAADVHPEQEHCFASLFSLDAGTENMESSSAQVQVNH
ncbi:hypothetical protein Tco_1084241 [Tanacetum coccineum]